MERLIEKCLLESSKNPIEIANNLMKNDFVPMHGPIHHLLDGAALLTAIYNETKSFDLKESLCALIDRAQKMPGAICGNWGVCGSATSVGAALSIIHGSGPLSNDQYYKDHMMLTSQVLNNIAKIGGPRCCKRNGFTALLTAVDFVNETYNLSLEKSEIKCIFSNNNKQCIGKNCPFSSVK